MNNTTARKRNLCADEVAERIPALTLRPSNTAARRDAGESANSAQPITFLPGQPPMPCPELLTESEAIRYLRLDTINIRHPADTLRRYREQGVLRATQVSKSIFYRRVELDRFLERITHDNPR